MRLAFRLLVLASITLLTLLPTGAGRLLTGSVANATSYHVNPAPFAAFKTPISAAGLMGLMQHSGVHFPGTLRKVGSYADASAGTPDISAVPPGLLLFNNDRSAMEQNETSITVRQIGSRNVNLTNDQVVGGVNDFRGFDFVAADGCTVTGPTQCYPALNCTSTSGFSVSLDAGRTLAKNGCLPQKSAAGTLFQPAGDPALDHDANGSVYYGSLAFDTAAGSPLNGIVIARSTPRLFDAANNCQNTTVSTNPCWTERMVSVDSQITDTNGGCSPGFCAFDDKDWVAVDRYSATPYQGSVYVVWNQYLVAGPNSGESHMVLSRCTPSPTDPSGFSACTAPTIVSKPGDDFTDGGSYVTVGDDGHVYVAYYNFGTTTTLYPIDGRVAVLSPGATRVQGYINMVHLTQDGTADTLPCLPNHDPPGNSHRGAPCQDNTLLDALAGDQFRAPALFKVEIDRSVGRFHNRLYTTFEVCTVPQYYPLFDASGANILYTGNCPKTDVIVARSDINFTGTGGLSAGPVSYTDLTGQVDGQQFFPYASVDEHSGSLIVTYESTQNDPFHNMVDVYAQQSRDGGASFSPLRAANAGRITARSYQSSSDPAIYFGQSAPFCAPFGGGGCPGYWPQNGDYIQDLASFGQLYTYFGATYARKSFTVPAGVTLTFVDNTLPTNQDDDFLASTPYLP
jgi:hypothetical protein